MKIRLDIVFKLFLSFWGASGIVSALAEVEPGNSCRDSSATNIYRCMTGESSQTLFTSVSNTTDVVVGGLLKDGEMLFIKGMRVEVEKMDFCVPSAAGGLTPLDKQLEGRQYFLRFTETNGVGFIWTEFDSFCGALRFADLACTLSSTMPAFMFRQKLRVNQSGVGDCQVELRDNGSVLLFVRGGIVVDVRNNDIELAKAIDELILTRTSERLKDSVGKSGLGRNGVVNGCELPQFIDALDKCETLWRSGKYEQLYKYVGEVAGANPKYVPARLLFAWREEQFGCQYEAEAKALRGLTNQLCGIFCEVNPELFFRLGMMADDAERMGRLCTEEGKDEKYRRSNYDPRKKRTKAPYLQRCYRDIPFLVPDVSLECTGISRNLGIHRRRGYRNKILNKDDLGKMIFDDKISYIRKKSIMDDYVLGIAGEEGVCGVISMFGNEAIQLNGYCALRLLRQNVDEAKRFLKDDLLRIDSSIGADKAKRMAVWALLQFAHDDPEIAIFLKQLPSKIDKSNWKTLAYLKDAINHLEQGCNRHFLKRGVK